jgi:hypothetical protein
VGRPLPPPALPTNLNLLSKQAVVVDLRPDVAGRTFHRFLQKHEEGGYAPLFAETKKGLYALFVLPPLSVPGILHPVQTESVRRITFLA